VKIGYLGPIWSYSYEAATKFNSQAELIPFETIDDVFEAVYKNE